MLLRHFCSTNGQRPGPLSNSLCQEQSNRYAATLSSNTLPLSSSLSSVYPIVRLSLFLILFFTSCCALTHGFTVKAESLSSYSSANSQPETSADFEYRYNNEEEARYREYTRRSMFRHPLTIPCTKHEMLTYCAANGGDICYRRRNVIQPLCRWVGKREKGRGRRKERRGREKRERGRERLSWTFIKAT